MRKDKLGNNATPSRKSLISNILLFTTLLCAAAQVDAQIFQCKSSQGKTVFQDTPCKEGKSKEVRLKQSNFMESNQRVENYSKQFSEKAKYSRPEENKKSNSSPIHYSATLQSCDTAKKAYEQEAAQIKARCKKGRETFCGKSAEDIQKQWDNAYLKRESGDAFSPPSQQWHAFNRSGGARIFTLKQEMERACAR